MENFLKQMFCSDKKIVNIVYITDESFVMPTTVSITSLKVNKDKNVVYKIFVISRNLSAESKEKIKMLESGSFIIEFREAAELSKYEDALNIERHVPRTAVLKFFIPEILNELDKVLYLDGDVIVQNDLSDFFSTNITEVYAGVVKDIENDEWEHSVWLEFPYEHMFNSGMMLMNLNKMRKNNISKKLIDYRLNGKNFFMDQDALNMVIGASVKFVDFKYNMLHLFIEHFSKEKLEEYYGVPFENSWIENYKRAVILHIAGSYKPWLFNLEYLTDLYRHYYMLSPYKFDYHPILNPVQREKKTLKPLQKIFSVSNDYEHKLVCLFGIKMRFKRNFL